MPSLLSSGFTRKCARSIDSAPAFLSEAMVFWRRNWDKPDCWFEADCFKLKEGEFGPQIRGSRRPPLNRADGLIGDTYFGYPAFYVRNHLQGSPVPWNAIFLIFSVARECCSFVGLSSRIHICLLCRTRQVGHAKFQPNSLREVLAFAGAELEEPIPAFFQAYLLRLGTTLPAAY